MKLMELENIDSYYGNAQALYDVSLFIEKGEIVTLLGANGAGKSTTLMTISGLVKPKKGKVLYEGKDITSVSPHLIAAQGIAHVPEGRRIFGSLSVEENLNMGAFTLNKEKKGDDIAEIKELIFSLFPRLKERINQEGGTLSGGEQQMLAIGRALMMQPKILLLDEPSMGIAPVLINQIFEKIKELNKKQDITIFLIEQNANVAIQIADRGYCMKDGQIVFEGNAQKLRNTDIANEYLGG
ncbi:MAG TPA: ABC transporter ATP-binding protein [Halanaerobiales bacterium]|nr:ABC transporter ATP-binding protein [Halanaerobiales bacterium]